MTKLVSKKIKYEFNNDKPMLLTVYIILFIIGIILLVVSGNYYRNAMLLLGGGINTQAIVTKFIEVDDGENVSYKPVFTFEDHQGKIVSFESPSSFSQDLIVWKKGESVSIVYDPAMPSIAKVVSYWGLFRGAITSLMIAAPFLIVSIGYFAFLGFVNSFQILQLF